MKLKNGIEILSLERKLGSVRMRAPFSTPNISASDELIKKLRATGVVSQFFRFGDGTQRKNDNFNFERVEDVLPKPEDYILVQFRAISKTLIDGYFLDFTMGDVLKESTPLLLGQTVYPNHDFCDINNWLGSVSGVAWDDTGDQFEGVAGINTEFKIDALMNPRIARGLLMDPPAIHSTSMTILFEFEFSHPDLVEQGRFWQLLGDEVEGSIVRLIVTKVQEYWEASLVFQGADRYAKKINDGEDNTDEDFADMSAPPADQLPPANSNQEKTMKLTDDKKKELGIEFDGEDVPETVLLVAGESLAAKLAKFGDADPDNLTELQAKAAAGDKYTELQRGEVTRLAKLAELGADSGDLPAVVDKQIKAADFDTLVELETFYEAKVAAKFPAGGRSSQEDSDSVDNAGGVATQEMTVPEVGLL
jgi:hypothetical protein